VQDFLSQTDLTALVKEKMDDDELRHELDIRIQQYVDEKRMAQQALGYRASLEDPRWAEAMREVVEMNLRDARRIGRIKDYIRSNRNSAQGLKQINGFWSDFKETFYKEKNYVRLQPQNQYLEPIIVRDNLSILGKVIGVFRKL
jgi:hypothetical protein